MKNEKDFNEIKKSINSKLLKICQMKKKLSVKEIKEKILRKIENIEN